MKPIKQKKNFIIKLFLNFLFKNIIQLIYLMKVSLNFSTNI